MFSSLTNNKLDPPKDFISLFLKNCCKLDSFLTGLETLKGFSSIIFIILGSIVMASNAACYVCSFFQKLFTRISEGSVPAVSYPEFFWAYWYMYRERDFNESIGEHTVRETDRQKLWLYLAAFR